MRSDSLLKYLKILAYPICLSIILANSGKLSKMGKFLSDVVKKLLALPL